jgi:hypothetical protein
MLDDKQVIINVIKLLTKEQLEKLMSFIEELESQGS